MIQESSYRHIFSNILPVLSPYYLTAYWQLVLYQTPLVVQSYHLLNQINYVCELTGTHLYALIWKQFLKINLKNINSIFFFLSFQAFLE